MIEELAPTAESKERKRCELPAPLIYRERDLDAVTRMSRKAREDAMRDGEFPKPILLSVRARGWLVSEIHDWLASRPRAGA